MATKKARSTGENATHFSAIRVRVNGIGKLHLGVFSIDNVTSKTLTPLDLAPASRYSLTRLVNFLEQRASFTLSVQDIGENFRINRIVVFTKEIYKSYPGS